MQTMSKHHEQIRTLEDIVENDKAGMIISPEIGLHENVAVLDFNDEYANLIMNHNITITYENLLTNNTGQAAILPSIVSEIVKRRIHPKRLLKTENQFFVNYAWTH
jgi:DNA polymerase elongation subunit (family B)